MAAIASVAMNIVAKVIGSLRRRPPILFMSCSPPSAWMTEPAHRNSRPLKNAWVMTWKMPDANAPVPTPRNM